MALKIVNTESLDRVADALNEAAGKSGKLVFPDEYISTAKGLSAGGGGGSDGYDIATMQKFIDSRGSLERLYYYGNRGITDEQAKLFSLVDLKNISNWDYAFYGCRNLTKIPITDWSSVTSAKDAFYGCSAIEGDLIINAPLLTQLYETVSETKITSFKLTSKPLTSLYSAFNRCTKLESFELPDCSGVTDMYATFNSCNKLRRIENLTVSATTLAYTFQGCNVLEHIGIKFLAAPTSMSYLAEHCNALKSFPELDVRNITYMSNMFGRCYEIEEINFKNIKAHLQVGSGDGSNATYDYGYKLKVDNLISLCYELRDTGSVKTLTIGSANLEKLASVYVRQIDITDEMRAEDDLIDEKLPFERCESTDEGATLIGDYILAKNWKLA